MSDSDFKPPVVKKAWQRQEKRCAACDRLMVWDNRAKRGARGAWQAHHQIPVRLGGKPTLRNCILLHIGCHLSKGHAGNTKNRVPGSEKNFKARNRSSYNEWGKAVRGLRQEY